jgi:hypothetical protein
MGLFDRLLGRDSADRGGAGYRATRPTWGTPPGQAGASGSPSDDEAAIARYHYLLRTAPPERIEEAHAEAFAALTPQQRRQVLEALARDVPAAERADPDDPRGLARMATRAEMRRPGTLERAFGGAGGMGMGGMIAGGLLAGVAGAFIGSAVVDGLFDEGIGDAGLFDVGDGGSDVAGDFGDFGDFGGF